VRERSRARGRVRDAGGVELLERLDHLDAHRTERRPAVEPPPAPERGAATDVDVAIVGGGLWSLLAPVLAARSVGVAVFDRARVGATHREWNASGPELRALVDAGVVTAAELAELIVARYDHGVCAFHGGGRYPVSGVLDHAVDAGPLLGNSRALAERRGASVHDGCSLVSFACGPTAVRLRFRTRDGVARDVTAKLMVDARGAASSDAVADLVCPTVGGVLQGLVEGDGPDEINPRVGEILATVDAVDAGRQHVWEAFPGRPGETTVYLFYYARADESTSLADLYGRFFATLSGYKRGEARLLRPTFGYIPGWSRLSKAPTAPDARVVLVGDAAARHSPLTYCGFGATLRSLVPAADAICRSLLDGRAAGATVVDDAPIHALTGVLAHMMAARTLEGDELNTLLDAAFQTLHQMGNEPYARLLRDEMTPAAFVEFLRRTASRHPAVWRKVARGIGLKVAGRWSLGLARAMVASA